MKNIKKYWLFLFVLFFFLITAIISINAQSTDQSNQVVTVSPTLLPSLPLNEAISGNTVNALLELAKSNIERSNLWFTWMLGIAGIILTIITILLAFIGYLVWKHLKQAKQAEDLLTELEKRRKQFNESGQFIADQALMLQALRKRPVKLSTELGKSEVLERAKKNRGFSPILYKAVEDKAVYAIDEYGYKHWIPNPPTLIRLGYSWSDVKQINKDELDNIPTGKNIPDLTEV